MLLVILFSLVVTPSLIYLSWLRTGETNFQLVLVFSLVLTFVFVIGSMLIGGRSPSWFILEETVLFHPILFPLGRSFHDSAQGWINYYYQLQLLGVPITPLIYRDYHWSFFAFPLMLGSGLGGWIFGMWLSLKRLIPTLTRQNI